MIIAIAIFFAYICAKVIPSSLLDKEMTANLNRFKALVKLGDYLLHFKGDESTYTDLNKCVKLAAAANGWFTYENITKSFTDWGNVLTEDHLNSWLQPYNSTPVTKTKNIALILAGNIPLVGFHDLICVWLSGHQSTIKCASKDEHLLPFLCRFLENEADEYCFTFTKEPFSNFDAVIATGSDNAGRYFDHYFGNYPHIIRKNRNGIAVLDGGESQEDLQKLGLDILQYFGLGCRNVSKLYLPKNYDLNLIFGGLYPLSEIIQHAKYANNYDYNKAIFLMSEFDFLENGFIILRENSEFSAPIACVHYEYYDKLEDLNKILDSQKDKIQCVISKMELINAIPFGKAQKPKLNDYADGVDTLAFLKKL
jgi:hypothetical protein